jgi:hypothetical protein
MKQKQKAPGGTPAGKTSEGAARGASKTATAFGSPPLAVEVVTEPTIKEDFDAFRKLDTQAKVFATKASAALILTGVEGTRLKQAYDIHRGGDQTDTRARLLWPHLCERYAGISAKTVDRRIALATAAATDIPILREVLNGDADFRSLADDKKQQLDRALRVLTDGKSQRQLMWDFGLARESKLKGGEQFDRPLVAQWCRECNPDLPRETCEALPGRLKNEFRQWARTQSPPENIDRPALLAIDALNVMAGREAAARSCQVATLKAWIAASQAVGRMLKAVLDERT